MVFLPLIIILVIAVVYFVYQAMKSNAQNRNENITSSYKNEQDQWLVERSINIDSEINCAFYRIIIDTMNQTLYIGGTKHREQSPFFTSIPFSRIIGSETIIDGKTETRITGGIGRAVVGGVLAGGAGAIVGAVTSKSMSEDKINSFKVNLLLNDIANPLYTFTIIDSIAVTKDSLDYKRAIEFSDRLNATVRAIVNQNEAEVL